MTAIRQERRGGGRINAWRAAALALALAGCGPIVVPMEPPIPADASGPDPAVAESLTQADAVMTCDTIATERAGIAASLQRLDGSAAAASLHRRDASLARLAALKGCRP
jgi:hypothetical protein